MLVPIRAIREIRGLSLFLYKQRLISRQSSTTEFRSQRFRFGPWMPRMARMGISVSVARDFANPAFDGDPTIAPEGEMDGNRTTTRVEVETTEENEDNEGELLGVHLPGSHASSTSPSMERSSSSPLWLFPKAG